jgi:hypothetical protein
VTHLAPGSAADKAGVREGMVLSGWSIYGGDVNREVELHVQEGDAAKTIKYRPQAAHGIDVYEFHQREDAVTRADCRRWIGAQ